MKKGVFIAFEGIDGSGKGTQISLLMDKIVKKGVLCYQTCEPSPGPVGSMIRQILTGRMKTDNRVIAAMFAADRLDHILNDVDGMLNKIEKGVSVITDRYYFSSYAYHSVDVPMDWVIKTNEESVKVLRPDLTIFLDIDADTAMDRIMQNRFHQELFEKKTRLEKVRENYFKAFDLMKEEENVLKVDGSLSPETISEIIWKKVEPLFEASL